MLSAVLVAPLLLGGGAQAEPSTLVAYAGDAGTGYLGSGFDTGISDPKKLVLKVKVKPDVKIDLEYDVHCKSEGREDGYAVERQASSRRIRLPLPIPEPKGCLVYAFGSYDGNGEREVEFRLELRAKQRGYQPPPPEPIDPSEIQARLKVEPRQVASNRLLSIRAIGRHAPRFITGIDLRLDRQTPEGEWKPAYMIFADPPEDDLAGDPIRLPPRRPILILAIGYDPVAERQASLKRIRPGDYRLRMVMSPRDDERFPDNVRLYRTVTVLSSRP